MRFYLTCFLMLALYVSLAGCGKKPSKLDAPGTIDPTLESRFQDDSEKADKKENKASASPFGDKGKKVKDPFPAIYPKPWL